jgi:hypothetical protein
MRHDIEWVTAPPLWELAEQDPGGRPRFRQPALLRFDSDAFMEELIPLVERGDPGVADRVARPESWDKPAAGWVAASDPSLAEPLRLYQPVHGRHYAMMGALVCRRLGLPQRRVDAAAGERASMLVRRLVARPGRTLDPVDPDTFTEQAWIGDRKAGTWRAAAAVVEEGEERLPLFPLSAAGDQGRTRLVWAGMLPVAGREVYETAAAEAAPAPAPPAHDDPLAELGDPRRATFVARIIQGLTSLRETPPPTAPASALDEAAADMREALAFVLLDLVDFLDEELPAVWKGVKDGVRPAGPAGTVYDRLGVGFADSGTWRAALLRADAFRPALLGTGTGTGQPPVPVTFTGAKVREAVCNLVSGRHFQDAVFDALGEPAPEAERAAAGGAPVAAARAAAAGEAEGGLYWIRFLYERPACEPYHDPVISAPSRPFRLAEYFDPEAPARPLLIRMPFDTSPAGLRRFPKGVGVLMSSKLRRQVERVRNRKLDDIVDGNVDEDPGWGIGMICSLSIPIITLCAFIVLMIFLQLLNIVFWWMAWFRICLPVPVRQDS